MKKTKTQKGITLIALIITIVVLMILAVVTINSVKDGGIIQHAQNSANKYNKAKDNEIDALASYEKLIEENNPNVKKIDEEYITQLFTNCYILGSISEDTLLMNLKDHLSIENNSYGLEDIYLMVALSEADWEMESIYIYIYEIDKLYKYDSSTNVFVCVSELDNQEYYNFSRNVKETREELERIFVGKTYDEMSQKLVNNELDQYVLEESDKISNISTYQTSYDINDDTIIRIETITITNSTGEFTLSEDEDNYSNWIRFKDGVCYTVQISAGT